MGSEMCIRDSSCGIPFNITLKKDESGLSLPGRPGPAGLAQLGSNCVQADHASFSENRLQLAVRLGPRGDDRSGGDLERLSA